MRKTTIYRSKPAATTRRWLTPVRAALLALLLSAGLPAGSLPAQLAPPPVQAGQRVRLTLTNEQKGVEGWVPAQMLRGGVTQIDDQALLLVLHPDMGPARVSFNAITRLELSAGVEAWWEAALRQGTDTALSVALQFFFYKWAADGFGSAWNGAFWGGAIGFVGGGIWGGFRPREIWLPTDWPTPEPPGWPPRIR